MCIFYAIYYIHAVYGYRMFCYAGAPRRGWFMSGTEEKPQRLGANRRRHTTKSEKTNTHRDSVIHRAMCGGRSWRIYTFSVPVVFRLWIPRGSLDSSVNSFPYRY